MNQRRGKLFDVQRVFLSKHHLCEVTSASPRWTGGALDVAGSMGVPRQRTDFGETLHKFGVGSGAYLVLPFAGPSSQRDAAGLLFDLAFNPVNHVLPKNALAAATAVKGLDFLGSRYRNSAFLDSLL